MGTGKMQPFTYRDALDGDTTIEDRNAGARSSRQGENHGRPPRREGQVKSGKGVVNGDTVFDRSTVVLSVRV
jgi:hypothetical protein